MPLAKLEVLLTMGLSQFEAASNRATRVVAGDQQKMAATAEVTNAAQKRFLASLERTVDKATVARSALLAQRAAQLGVSDAAASYIRRLEDAEKRQQAVNAATRAGAYLGPLLWTAAAGGLTVFLDGSLRAVDALNGLSAASGSSIENLSALDAIARRSGFGFGELQQLVLQVNKALEAAPDSGAGRALKALGLDAAELRRQDPAEAVRQIAVAIAGYADDANKGRLQQVLLGRATKESADFLKDLAGQTKLTATLTRDQAEAAEAYTKALSTLRAQTEDAARALTLKLAPALAEVLKGFNTGGIRGAGDAIGELIGLGSAYYEGKALGRLKSDLKDLEAQAKRLRTVVRITPTSPLAAELEQVEAQIAQRTEAIAAARAKYLRLTDGSAGGGRGFVNPEAVKPSLPDLGELERQGKAAEAAARFYADLQTSIAGKRSEAEAELAGGEKLSSAQQFALGVVQKLAGAEVALSDAQKRAAAAALEQYLATAATIEQRRDQRAAAEALAKSERESSEALDRQAEARLSANALLREQIEVIGLTADQVDRLRIARLEEAIATERAALAIARARDASEAQSAGGERNLRLLEEELRLRRELSERTRVAAQLEQLRTGADSLADGLAGAFGRALTEGGKFRDLLTDIGRIGQGVAVRVLIEEPLAESLRTTFRGLLPGAGADSATASQTAAIATNTGAVTTSTGALTALTQAAGAAAAALAAISGQKAASGFASFLGFGSPGGTGLEGLSPDALSYFYHDGGVAGAGGRAARMQASVFAGAKRYHSGGIGGLMPDEVPAILRKGEEVIRRDDPRHRANGGAGRPVNVYVENHAGAQVRAEPTGNGDVRVLVEAAVAEVDRRIAGGGSTYSALKNRFGLQPALARRG